ncbi:sugar transferase [Luteolibacter pohnpeiensis]|uniref:Sugar transferase n=1 Tax=Luteolibacter pohnpeiensis TaxID=454153 RepID=A0A934VR62_9BACT|nr:sugar transferase [Luteolibacter pohnpeiensis]MBK1882846.1 sugar transferase [Luteolibacter pohnpeiensis]
MISAREKGFFQLLVTLQIAVISILYWICFLLIFGMLKSGLPSLQTYTKYWIIMVFAMIFEAFSRPGALRPTPGRMKRLASPVSRRQWMWIIASVTALLVFSQDMRISRTFLGAFSAIALIALYLTNRQLIRWAGGLRSKHLSEWRLRTFILGPKEWCDSIIPEIKELHSMLDVKRVECTDGINRSAEEYGDIISEQPIDMLVMPPRHLPDSTVISLLRQGDRLGFRCWLPVELTRTYGRRFDLQRAGRLDVLTPPVEPLENTSNQFIKRIFDVAFSSLIVVTVLPPLCFMVWLIHRRHSPGPLFFKQDRVGKNGVAFKVFKFRTLHVDNGDESKQVTKGDSRVFKGGQFLRKTSLDEIPQFLNVLFGDMSVVGPRPHMEKHDCEFREIFERYGVRRYVKPGVTGLAQVKGFRGEVNRPQDLRHRARLDNFYVTHWDVALDIGIVAMTGFSMLKPPKTAY